MCCVRVQAFPFGTAPSASTAQHRTVEAVSQRGKKLLSERAYGMARILNGLLNCLSPFEF